MKDILLIDNDLCFAMGSGDFEFVEGVESIKQDKVFELQLSIGDDLSSPLDGTNIPKYLNSEKDELVIIAMKREIKKIIMKGNEVKKETIKVRNEGESYFASFDTSLSTVKNWKLLEEK